MSTSIALKKEDCYCNLNAFYEKVAKKLSFDINDNTMFDCRKICVTKSVEKVIWSYYREREEMDDGDIAALWLFCGPKSNIDDGHNRYMACAESGFVTSR